MKHTNVHTHTVRVEELLRGNTKCDSTYVHGHVHTLVSVGGWFHGSPHPSPLKRGLGPLWGLGPCKFYVAVKICIHMAFVWPIQFHTSTILHRGLHVCTYTEYTHKL